ncbi:hypothetical protein DKT77_10180 [Meridianimarinicoccus roseus]|uniref:Uncharacterized protein n=1 Tax=Meridianimarinicoccus roseus TaxID=2072018 RepID=A0A2V2LBA1_9RHOB|nr:hypothetical protein [Meridianimarinicoccus roseus]PWR02555.1 hypothetical protein DKT77_10180 [Meridianimarinicoccus roseus]
MLQERATISDTPLPTEAQDIPVPAAFASIRLGDTQYTVGEDVEGGLHFTAAAGGNWKALTHTLEDGWHDIGAEILVATRDALHDYLRMHLIRLTQGSLAEAPQRFDIMGFEWELRRDEDGTVAIRLPLHDWRAVKVTGTFDTDREFAIAAFAAARPDLSKSMAEDVLSWAKRLAAGAVVMPVM